MSADNWVCVFKNPKSLKPGQITEFSQDNTELVIWRSESGKLCASEARCPHQWSHLAAEGQVTGEELVCTSHFWTFNLSGQGYKENLQGRRDKKSDLKTYPCQEKADGIYVQLEQEA